MVDRVEHEEHEIRIDVDDSADGDRLARIRGVLDVFSSPALATRALANLPDKTRDLIIDLREVSFVDSAGVSALVRLQQEAKGRALDVRARFGGAQHTINATVVDVLRRVLSVDD
ncbi:MAG TPA: STAS domain-containing protein [Acidimicrobiia bacterium]|jgi:anti-anti-sigma factor|nr:STAS domain-containing protein [Acidimicrobiia bacterium]